MNDERKYDLETRTEKFSLRVRDLCRLLKHDIINREYIIQLIRAAGSVGANYIEANDKVGDKDLRFKIRISKREAKECRYWLNHIDTNKENELESERLLLINEAEELMKIFAAILRKLGD
ncbi:MAG: four helix bundle protein [Bacteroidota bacterium]|nr:four helix bundle protein [Bacteroidota bacterium]